MKFKVLKEEKIFKEGFNPLTLKTKGLVRDPQNDFNDDGNHFRAYLYKGVVPVTYLKDNGDVYMTIAFHHLDDIDYQEYKQFPSYKDSDIYNGVPEDSVDVYKFISILDQAKQDIEEFRGNVKPADKEAYKKYMETYANYYKELLKEARDFIGSHLDRLLSMKPEGYVKMLFDYYQTLKRYANNYSNNDVIDNATEIQMRYALSDAGKNRQAHDIEEKDNNFYLKEIKKILSK